MSDFEAVTAGEVVLLKFRADSEAEVQRWVSFKVASVDGREDQMRLVSGDGEVFWSSDWSLDIVSEEV